MKLDKEEMKNVETRIAQMVAELEELGCDSASVLVTCRHGNGTASRTSHAGNYYARAGLMRDWLECQKCEQLADWLIIDNDEE